MIPQPPPLPNVEKGTVHVVTFRLDRLVYALPIEPIRQIIEMVTITPVPQVRDCVEGVINFRGSTIPVVNLRQHLGMPKIPLKLHTPLIVADIADRLVGLIVDDVVDVIVRPLTQIVHPQDILPQGLGETPLLQGLFQVDGRMVLLLDIEHLFQPHQAQALAEAVTALPAETPPLTPPQETPPPAPKKGRRTGKKKDAGESASLGEAPAPQDGAV